MSDPAGIPSWNRLTPDARQALCDLAELVATGVPLTAEITFAQGSCKTFGVRMGRAAAKKLLTGDS